jgi:hypothetical protein
VKVNIDDALKQMLTTLYGCGVIPIFPKSTLPSLPLIILPSRSSSHELDRSWNYISVSVIDDKQMNMIGGYHVVQDHQAITPLGLQ